MLLQCIDPTSQRNAQPFTVRGSSADASTNAVFWVQGNNFCGSQIQWFPVLPITDLGEVQTTFAIGTTGTITPLWLSEVVVPGRRFLLNWFLTPRLYVEDSTWYCESESLGILAFGHSSAEAIHSFVQDFSALWDAIAQAPDDSLTADALDVKRAFRRIVKSELPG